jgi:glycosyltransferase involved in cell wall biosynthesis
MDTDRQDPVPDSPAALARVAHPGAHVAVLVPCFNEERSVAAVVESFHHELPDSDIYIYDNNSTDGTAEAARGAGAVVRSVGLQGKGNVVRRMFADIEADVYVLVDGDDTYDATRVHDLVDAVDIGGCDLVNASRLAHRDIYTRRNHAFGNRMLCNIVERLFGREVDDMLSGYKAFSRRYVKSLPLFATGFELETELTVHALELMMPMASVPTPYRARREDSFSKLRTYRDGFRILRTIGALLRRERPLRFFFAISVLLVIIAVILGAPLIGTFLSTHKVPRYPTAIVIIGLVVVAALSLTCGLILETVTRGRKEAKMLSYLQLAGPQELHAQRLSTAEPRFTDTRPPVLANPPDGA